MRDTVYPVARGAHTPCALALGESVLELVITKSEERVVTRMVAKTLQNPIVCVCDCVTLLSRPFTYPARLPPPPPSSGPWLYYRFAWRPSGTQQPPEPNPR